MSSVKKKNLVLKRVRKEQGKTLRELADELGVNWSTVSYWENGVKVPRDNNKMKLATIFKMTSDELLKEDN